MSALQTVHELLARHDPPLRVAVVGATNNTSKMGHRIVEVLRALGIEVLPVHPHDAVVAGLPAWPSVEAIPGFVDIVDLVVPPAVAAQVVRALPAERVAAVWFQPGSSDVEAVAAASDRFATVIVGDCVMVEARRVRSPR